MDTSIVAVGVTYQVQFESSGSKADHWPQGTWFQFSPFIDQPYSSIEDAKDEVKRYIETANRSVPRYRIVQKTVIVTVVVGGE